MSKRVILTLMPGSFEQGFPVILRIKSDSGTADREIQVVGQMPPAPNILQLFKQWQSAYRQIVMPHSRIEPLPNQVINVSCHQLGFELSQGINEWLNSGFSSWQKIRDRLQQHLDETDEILVIIETDDMRLRQLPWHLWDLFSKHYVRAEVVLSVPEYQSLKDTTAPFTNKVRILAVLGNSADIDIEKDRAILKQLPDAEITFLVKPQRQSLNNQLWDKQWDILFFAGHSSSQEDGNTGRIYINQTDSLSLTELKNALRRAIERGLQLAIFNSCDGLGLARELAPTQIPQIIVMREPVPDVVAQEFLQHFLKTFAEGKSLYLAVRASRERLQGLEAQFPYATWLPVICQNPASVPPTWHSLCARANGDAEGGTRSAVDRPVLKSRRSSLHTVLLASVFVTAAIMGVRHLGILQIWELQAFDQSLRLRADEGPDPRLLVVAITEEDFQLPEQQQRIGSLSDRALALVLKKLGQFKPRAIGLDIYRDFPVDPKQADLAARMRHDENFIAVCKVSDPEANHPGISPPPEIPTKERIGFSDFVVDPDGILRRHIIAMKPGPTSPCTTPYAFSTRLAFRYLEAEGISPKYTEKWDLQIGNVVFKRLREHMGGYQRVDAWDYQILLNYRSYHSPEGVAPIVTLKDVLTDKVNSDDVKDRIVLIGVTAKSVHDDFPTPYTTGQWPYQKMPGVIAQAQMVSQLLSAVKDGRSLLWVWPSWGEALWVYSWSVVGGILAWRIQHSWSLGLAGVTAVVVLYGVSFGVFTQGGWIPVVPPALAMVVTGGSVVAYSHLQTQRQQHNSVILAGLK